MASFRDFRAKEAWGAETWKALLRMHQTAPLIQCITDFSCSMDLMANTLMAVGATPSILQAVEEIRESTASANAVCINIGTLSPECIFSMKVAAARACELHKTWVLDPVGAGATKFRTAKCLELLALRPAVIHGNQMEIMALADAFLAHKEASQDALQAAKELARGLGGTVVAVNQGAVDLVTDGKRVLGVSNGVPFMQKITSIGSASTALIAAFVSVNQARPLEASAFALALLGLAGEMGMEKSNGPASLSINLFDSLHSLASDESAVTSRIKISQI